MLDPTNPLMFSHIKRLSDLMTAKGAEVTNGSAQGTSNLVVDFSPRPVSDNGTYVVSGRTVHPDATYMLVLFCTGDSQGNPEAADQVELEFIEWLRTEVQVVSVLHQRQTDDYARQTYVEVVLPYELI